MWGIRTETARYLADKTEENDRMRYPWEEGRHHDRAMRWGVWMSGKLCLYNGNRAPNWTEYGGELERLMNTPWGIRMSSDENRVVAVCERVGTAVGPWTRIEEGRETGAQWR